MQTVAFQHEYINEYVRSNSIEDVGTKLLWEFYSVPFEVWPDGSYSVNKVLMSNEEMEDYIREFFESLDTTSILELYNHIKAQAAR